VSSKKATVLAVLLVVSAVAYLLACSQATWSPDGKRIAFVVMLERGESFHLYVAPTDGGKGRLLWKSDSRIGPPIWSPDGTTLAVVNISRLEQARDAPESKDLPRAKDVGSSKGAVLTDRLYLLDVASGNKRLLAEQKFIGEPKLANDEPGLGEPFPQWVAGGKRILWPLEGLTQARLIDVEDGKLIKQWDDITGSPVVSPSGKLAAMMRGKTPESGVMLVTVDLETMKEESKVVMGDDKTAVKPLWALSWSPDSSTIVFAGTDDKSSKEPSGIWLVGINSNQAKQILKEHLGAPIWVDWSPKGDLLAMSVIVADKPKKESGICGVWTLKPDGTALKRIDQPKNEEDKVYHPVFSPDGMRLTYRRVRKGDKWERTVIYDIAKGTEKVIPVEIPSPKPNGPPEKKAPPDSPSKPEGSEEKK